MSNIFNCTYTSNMKIDFNLNITNLLNIYSPLIGSNSIHLYLQLYNEKNFLAISNSQIRNLSDLCKKLNFSFSEFNECKRRLEAFGLIKSTIVKDEISNNTKYSFFILEPLSFNEFIDNNKFKKSLINKLGISFFEELEFYYNQEDLSKMQMFDDYEDIFDEFNSSEEYLFNFDKLIDSLQKIIKNNVEINYDAKDIIEYFFKNYNVSYKDIEIAILNSIVIEDNKYLIENNKLEKEISNRINTQNDALVNNIIELKRVDDFFTNETIDEYTKKQIFNQYKNTKSEDFLASLQKHKLSENDLAIIRCLRFDYMLPNKIINILIDFSISRTHGKINIMYLKKVAKTLNLIGATSLPKAYTYFLSLSKPKNLKFENKKAENQSDSNEISLVDVFTN